MMQIRNYRYTGGYVTSLTVMPALNPPNANETWMCGAQMVRREEYQSLSVLGNALIIGIGSFIILVNLTLNSIVGYYQRRHNKSNYATKEWDILEAETLQRCL